MGNYQRKDALYHRAKQEGYLSRAAYKLIELDDRHSLLRSGGIVLDLGCFPGGWLQAAGERVGSGGRVIGVDLRPLDEPARIPENAVVLEGDLYDAEVQERVSSICGGRVDTLLSDMSPKLSGIRFQDAARSSALVELAIYYAERFLRPGGCFAAKIFPGTECEELSHDIRPLFDSFSRTVLRSSRKSSREVYFVAKGFRGAETRPTEGDYAIV